MAAPLLTVGAATVTMGTRVEKRIDMRRTDRTIQSRQELDDVLQGSLVCHLGFAAHGRPYVVPLSFGYDGTSLYIHTAAEGKKIDCIRANATVCFQVERNVRLVPDRENACGWTFAFESVIGYGEVSELTDPEEKAYGLNQIMVHYSRKEWQFETDVFAATRVWRIAIDALSGKRSVETSTG